MIIIVIGCLLLIFLIKHLFFWKPIDTDYLYLNGPLMMGHRGVPNLKPENTISGFEYLINMGIKGIEVDVISTKDKQIICSHNHDLEFETDGNGYISKKNYVEIKKFNTSGKFLNSKPISIPRLEDLINKLPKETIFNIEIKSSSLFDLKALPIILNIISKQRIKNRVIISSFNPLILLLIKILDKNIPTGYLWSNFNVPLVLSNPCWINLVHPDLIHPDSHLIDKKLISYFKKKGLKINAWTVNNLPLKNWLLKNGVDGIISDFPLIMINK